MRNKPPFFGGLNALILLFTVYGGIHVLEGTKTYLSLGITVGGFNYLKSIYLSLLPLYSFYYLSIQGYLTESKLKVWVFFFFIICTSTFFYNQNQQLEAAIDRGSSREEFTNNTAYLFLSLLPSLALFQNRRIIQYFGLLYIIVFLVLSVKRGALLIGAISCFVFIVDSFKYSKKNQRLLTALLIVAIGILTIYLVKDRLQNSDYFTSRLYETIEGNSSHRDVIFTYFWNYFITQTSLFRIVFGNGANATLDIFQHLAHNDWLELLINQGLFGAIVYIVFWACFFKSFKQSEGSIQRMILGQSLLILFMQTLFSMSYSSISLYASSCLGYALAINYKTSYSSSLDRYGSIS